MRSNNESEEILGSIIFSRNYGSDYLGNVCRIHSYNKSEKILIVK